MLRKACLAISLFSILFFAGCNTVTTGPQRASVAERGELVVAMDVEMPGYFILGGENYGYQYELFKAYADHLGVDLRIVDGLTSTEGEELLSKGEVDILTTISSHIEPERTADAIPVYTTSYVMLTKKERAKEIRKSPVEKIIPFLKESDILVSSGFKTSRMYNELLDSLPEANIYVSTKNSFELIERLGEGVYDYLICEMSEAQLGCALTHNVEQMWTFNEPVSVSALFTPTVEGLRTGFNEWMTGFRNGEEYAVLNYLYFERGIVSQVLNKAPGSRVLGGISAYDKMLQRICGMEGYDWRLISAIIYSESRFDPSVVSNRGAKGLMQIMPAVAGQFKTGASDLMNPENNVLLGIKILGKIESSLKFPESTSVQERMKIVLACYNGGIGHVQDARNLARKYGGNPNLWEDVSRYLTLKNDPAYAYDDVVKCGRFQGRQTLAFVNEVFSNYTSYCNTFRM